MHAQPSKTAAREQLNNSTALSPPANDDDVNAFLETAAPATPKPHLEIYWLNKALPSPGDEAAGLVMTIAEPIHKKVGKRYEEANDGKQPAKFRKIEAEYEKFWRYYRVTVRSLDDVSVLLLAAAKRGAIRVAGRPVPIDEPFAQGIEMRRNGMVLLDEPSRFVAVDLDTLPLTFPMDPATAAAKVLEMLPPECRGVRTLVQRSAGYGITLCKNSSTLYRWSNKGPCKLRLWIEFAEPISRDMLKYLLRDYLNANTSVIYIDPSVWRPAQPIYLSVTFAGMEDRYRGQRWIMVEGDKPTVRVPDDLLAEMQAAADAAREAREQARRDCPAGQTDRENALGALGAISKKFDDVTGEDWFVIVAAVHHEFNGSQEGLDILHDFAKGSPKYRVEYMTARYDGMKAEGGVGLGSLIKIATDRFGYTPKKKKDPDAGTAFGDVSGVGGTSVGGDDDDVADDTSEGKKKDDQKLYEGEDGNLFTKDVKPLRYVIKGVLARGSLTTMTAITGHGKTALATEMLAAIISGRGEEILGVPVKQGRVAYIAYENPEDFRRKLAAVLHTRGIDRECISRNLRVFTESQSTTDMRRALRRWAKGGDLTLVVIDTLQAHFPGDDFNDNAQIVRYFRKELRPICETIPGEPATLVLGHPRKGTDAEEELVPFGGGSAMNEIDANLSVWLKDGLLKLHWCQKLRGAPFPPVLFKLRLHDSGIIKNEEGEQVPTPILDFIRVEKEKRMSARAQDRSATQLLAMIAKHPTGSQMDWAREMGLAGKGSVSRWLAKLQKERAVKKVGMVWTLTAAGKASLKTWMEAGGKLGTGGEDFGDVGDEIDPSSLSDTDVEAFLTD